MTSIGGRVENISSADEYCLYYREARESLEGFLENQGFYEIEEFMIPSTGVHNISETEDWYTVYEGSYKESSDFYIFVVHNDNFNNDDRCDFRVDITWRSTGFFWKLQKDEASIKEFNFLIQDWWEKYKD